MSNSALGDGIWQAFLDWLYGAGGISVPSDYHSRCKVIRGMIDNDITGTVNTLIDYSINSASEAKYSVECNDNTLQNLLNTWLEQVNININGIPTGLQSLSKEYYKERWQGSSLCILRASKWENITVNNVTIEVPQIMWFVNGSSIYVKRPSSTNYKLGSDKYYLDKDMKIEIKATNNENFTVQKPYNRWFDKYSTPYLIRKGIYKNYLAIKTLQEKSDEVISKFLPYLFIITAGTERLFMEGNVDYKDADLEKIVDNFKDQLEYYKSHGKKTPTAGKTFDKKFEHLIPDLTPILKEELYKQGYRSLLSGLGFVDVIQGVSSTRRESVLNPKPFVSEVNEGLNGFKLMLLDIIYMIYDRNKSKHGKMFSQYKKINIVNSPLKINVEQIIDSLRLGFVYGVRSIKTYQECLGLNPQTELERRKQEKEDGLEDLFYPHLIQNREDIPDRALPSNPTTKKEEEKESEKTKQPEHMEESELDLEIAPYTMKNYPDYLKKYPKGAIEVWVKVFNQTLKDGKGEDKAFPFAWTALKRWLKKHGYKKDNSGKYIKESK